MDGLFMENGPYRVQGDNLTFHEDTWQIDVPVLYRKFL
jgi:carboxypeptidase C (cathepsin A)